MPRGSKNCEPLAAEIAELILDMGSLPENNTLDRAVAAAIALDPELNLTRELAVDTLNEFLDSRALGGLTELQKQLAALKAEARLDRKLRSKIKELETAITEGEAIAEPIKFRRKISATIKSLRAESQRLGRISNLEESIRVLEKEIARGDVAPRKRTKKQNEQLTKKLEDRKKELTRQKNLLNQINSLKNKLTTRDFTTTSKEAQSKSKEVLTLEAERNELQKELQSEIDATNPTDFLTNFLSIATNDVRALLTAFDASAVGIQGLLLGIRRPHKVPRAFLNMVQSMNPLKTRTIFGREVRGGKEAAIVQMAKLRARDLFKVGEDAGLHLSEVDGGLTKGEEFFQAGMIKKIPLLGPIVSLSERGFISYLNTLRASSFDALVTGLGINSEVTTDEAELIANYVNVASGRGSSRFLDEHAKAFSTLLFSPRYQLSRFQYLFGQPAFKGIITITDATKDMTLAQRITFNLGKNKRARGLIAKEMLGTILSMWLFYQLWELGGGTVEDDPRSSDFGKLKKGNIRIDLTGGLRSPYVFLKRIEAQEVKSLKRGGKVREFGFRDIALFARGKGSPPVSFAIDLFGGEDIRGREVTAGSLAFDNLVPISVQDIVEEADSKNIPRTVMLSALSIFGINAQNFNPNANRPRKPRKERRQ